MSSRMHDEQVCAQLAHILWRHPQAYQNVVILMGEFHQLRVSKEYCINGMHPKATNLGWLDAGTIAAGSVERRALLPQHATSQGNAF